MAISRSPSVRGGRPTGDLGAALVEFALIAGLLATFMLGVFEIGMAWSDHQSLTQASRNGARVASQFGRRPPADNEALRAVAAALGAVDGTVTRVVIYEADVNGEMPTQCRTASGGYAGDANCNVYDAASFAEIDTPSSWATASGCGGADYNWCPVTERDDRQQSATFLGVRVEFERDYMTGFFGGGSHTISEDTVMRIEPAP